MTDELLHDHPAQGGSASELDVSPEATARISARTSLGGAAAFLVAVPFALLVMLVTSESERLERVDRGVADGLHDLVAGRPNAISGLEFAGRATDPWLLRAPDKRRMA